MDWRRRVAERFREVNGEHPMTVADDAYVSAQFVTLDALCAASGRDADGVRRSMLDGRLPLPGYLRSDGAEMVPADLFALAERAGGVDALEPAFTGYDRLRFGGPTSRDTCIDAVRARYPPRVSAPAGR
ncbi:hypothetical protein [Micromonospora chersina]|uniref:hypothetical protein n=1 Tax=Micromonospora chersina TaxID=47854 RepID=UPI00371EEEE6